MEQEKYVAILNHPWILKKIRQAAEKGVKLELSDNIMKYICLTMSDNGNVYSYRDKLNDSTFVINNVGEEKAFINNIYFQKYYDNMGRLMCFVNTDNVTEEEYDSCLVGGCLLVRCKRK